MHLLQIGFLMWIRTRGNVSKPDRQAADCVHTRECKHLHVGLRGLQAGEE